jgi:RNA polymerase primary sigma factor
MCWLTGAAVCAAHAISVSGAACDAESTAQVQACTFVQDENAVRSEQLLMVESIEQAVDDYLRQLPTRDACVLRMRYGLGGFERPHTLEEIGFRYAVTRERIRQIEAKALNFLKRSSLTDEMEEYVVEPDAELTRTASSVAKKSA